MTRPDYEDSVAGEQWVHERDYGSFALGGILLGIIEIVVGTIMLVVHLFRR